MSCPLPATAPAGGGSALAERLARLGHDGHRELAALAGPAGAGRLARELVRDGLLDLPLPGGGRTLARFEALQALGAADLSLARLAEGHVDAVAICAELGAPPGSSPAPGQLWGVWAADPPNARPVAREGAAGWVMSGTKAWCSGAVACTHALVTARSEAGYGLYAVAAHGPGVSVTQGSWPAYAMVGSDSRTVRFDDVPVEPVGGVGDYLRRPGFWQGAVGVAAVWLGGAYGVAAALWRAHARRPLDEHALAHAGAVDAALRAATQVLAASAAEIDDDPRDRAGAGAIRALRVRAVVERAAGEVLDRVGRALGAGPLALDREHGRRVADLGLYLRQSHAERDLAELGRLTLAGPGPAGSAAVGSAAGAAGAPEAPKPPENPVEIATG